MGKVADKIKEVIPGMHPSGTTAATGTTTGAGVHHTGLGAGGPGGYAATEGVLGGAGTGAGAYDAAPLGGAALRSDEAAYAGAETRTTTEAGATRVCGQEHFTKVEDRQVVKERVERLTEHHPVETEFVVETRPTGVVRENAGAVESHGVTERVVGVTEPKSPCDL